MIKDRWIQVPMDSTVNQLTDLYNTFCQASDEGKEV